MEKSKIQWNGKIDRDSEGAADNNEVPSSVDIVWGGYVPCWYDGNYSDCEAGIPSECHANLVNCRIASSLYFEDFDQNYSGTLDDDSTWWASRSTMMQGYGKGITLGNNPMPENAPKTTYTWGDVSFVIEIADGLGTGGRRAREARLHKFDKDTKKRLIHLICRVKGEKVYDEEKEVGDIQIKLEDADLVIKEVLGKMRVENTNVL